MPTTSPSCESAGLALWLAGRPNIWGSVLGCVRSIIAVIAEIGDFMSDGKFSLRGAIWDFGPSRRLA